MKNILCIMMVSVCLIGACNVYSDTLERQPSYAVLFDEICQLVEENFYNASLIQEEFSSIRTEYSKKIETLSTLAEFSAMVNVYARAAQCLPYLLFVAT